MVPKKIPKKIPKYSCDFCYYTTGNRKDFLKHCSTKKHDTKMIPLKNQKIKYFECNDCDYITCCLEDLDNHFVEFNHTKKIPSGDFSNNPITSDEKNMNCFVCDKCSKTYKYKSGYYRHLKKCQNVINDTGHYLENEELVLKFMEAAENSSKLCEKLMEIESKGPQIINNTFNNQKLNINVFLNNEFKDAMNITDFLNEIKLSIDDLNYTKKNGYIKGITNIFVRNLEEIDVNDRPIHSVNDQNSKQYFYIKGQDEWQQDKQEFHLDKTIDKVAKKQINKIKEWESGHPYWNMTDEGIEEYMNMVKSVMGGTTESERSENRKLIKQGLMDTVTINNEKILCDLSDNTIL